MSITLLNFLGFGKFSKLLMMAFKALPDLGSVVSLLNLTLYSKLQTY